MKVRSSLIFLSTVFWVGASSQLYAQESAPTSLPTSAPASLVNVPTSQPPSIQLLPAKCEREPCDDTSTKNTRGSSRGFLLSAQGTGKGVGVLGFGVGGGDFFLDQPTVVLNGGFSQGLGDKISLRGFAGGVPDGNRLCIFAEIALEGSIIKKRDVFSLAWHGGLLGLLVPFAVAPGADAGINASVGNKKTQLSLGLYAGFSLMPDNNNVIPGSRFTMLSLGVERRLFPWLGFYLRANALLSNGTFVQTGILF